MADQYPSLDLLYNETRDLLVRQLANVDSLNTKASIVIGFDGLVIASALGLAVNVAGLDKLGLCTFHPWKLLSLIGSVLLIGLGTILLVASLLLALSAYWVSRYRETLDPRQAHNRLIALPEHDSRLELLHAFINSYEENQQTIKHKSILLIMSFCALLSAVGVYAVTILMVLIAFI